MSKDEILKAGIDAARTGERSKAGELFAQVVRIDPASEQGWLGLGFCVSTPEQREYCFGRVLALNPNNRVARDQLARLGKAGASPSPAPAAPPAPAVKIEEAPRPAQVAQAAPVRAFTAVVPAFEEEVVPAGAAPTTPKVARPKQAARRKKKSNTALIAALVLVGVLILGVTVIGAGYVIFYSGISPELAANAPATSTSSSQAGQATSQPTTGPTATPNPPTPTPIPSPLPTVVYTPRYESITCPFNTHGAAIDCGHLIVPEDRTGDPAHTIKLAVVVFHSHSQTPAEPVVFLQGGPGGAAVLLSANAQSILVAPFLAKRDFVTFDQRGTGLSEPALKCDALAKLYLDDIHGLIDSSTRNLVYSTAFRDCNGLMQAQGIKLRAYTTEESAADVRDLLAALKYPQADLYGASYGTRLAQVVMRDYPEIVHAAILDSVVPVDTSLFSNYSDSVAAGLKTLFSDCANDPACSAAYPDLETKFWASVKQLDATPIKVTSSKYPTGFITQTVTGETVINVVLGLIKSSRYVNIAPQTISRFQSGDFSMLAMVQSSLPYSFDDIAPGLFINMTCHEQVLSTTLEAAQTQANSTIIRDYSWLPFYGSIADIFKTCKSWGAAAPARGENDPTISDIPSLVITGSYDPTTPPVYAKQIAAHLSHSYYFEFPTLGHTPTAADSSGCAMDIARRFLDDPSSEPDRSCMGDLKLDAFIVPYTGTPPLALKGVASSGIRTQVPKDWHSDGQGFYYRGNSALDITEVGVVKFSGNTQDIQNYYSVKAYGYRGLDGPLVAVGERKAHGLTWQLFTSSSYGRPVDIAMVDSGSESSIAILQFCNKDEHDALYQTVFLPMVDAATK